MRTRLFQASLRASMTLAAVSAFTLAAQTGQAAERKVLMENFVATW